MGNAFEFSIGVRSFFLRRIERERDLSKIQWDKIQLNRKGAKSKGPLSQ